MASTLLDRLVGFLADTLDALGMNGTRLRWKWNQRRRDLGEAGMRGEMIVRSARTRYKMCPQCRALVPRSAYRCSECGAGLSRVRAPGFGRLVANVIPGATAATGLLLLANGLVFALTLLVPVAAPPDYPIPHGLARLWSLDGATLVRYGSGVSELTIHGGQWWRLVTPLFLHAGILHFAFNSMALASLGPLAEEEYGTDRFLSIYLFSGICGSVLAQFTHIVATVGASGAICGLLGLLLVHGWKRGGAYGGALKSAMLKNTVLLVVVSLMPGIDWRGHLGGFLAGAAAGLVVPSGAPRSRGAAIAWSVVQLAFVALVLVAFWRMAVEGEAPIRMYFERWMNR